MVLVIQEEQLILMGVEKQHENLNIQLQVIYQ